ncbi:hypothetical protein D9M73_202580 [compost metagenome]
MAIESDRVLSNPQALKACRKRLHAAAAQCAHALAKPSVTAARHNHLALEKQAMAAALAIIDVIEDEY